MPLTACHGKPLRLSRRSIGKDKTMQNIQNIVQEDYSALVEGIAGSELEMHRQSVCCVERYDTTYLRRVPKVVVDADLGCGNPTRYLRSGDRVLDIGCGAGMNCYIASQIVGSEGEVIGIDFTPSMLAVARGALEEFRRNVPDAAPMRFIAASASDLALDIEWANACLAANPPQSQKALQEHLAAVANQRHVAPAISDGSVDVVISNCVINLLDDLDKSAVFWEIARVLKPGGRFAISDNVSNISVPESVKNDRVLWSACYAGVLQEQEFYAQLEKAGLVNIRIEVRNPDPALTVENLVFYSITVTGEKMAQPVAAGVSAMYRGPFKALVGESGKMYRRGVVETVAAADQIILADPEAAGFFLSDASHTPAAPAAASRCCG
jgi:arsenite methyltransferase